MKKFLMLLTLLLPFCAMYAMPVGNPAEVVFHKQSFIDKNENKESPNWHFRLGYFGDHVWDRALEGSNSVESVGFKHSMNGGMLYLNLMDMADVGFGIASSDYQLNTAQDQSVKDAVAHYSIGLASEYDIAYVTTAKARIYQVGNVTVTVSGAFIYSNPDIETFSINGFTSFPCDIDLKHQEYQGAVAAAYAFADYIPYVGISIQHAKLKTNIKHISDEYINIHLPEFENDNKVNFVVGASMTKFDMLSLTAEGRFMDEFGVHVNAQLRF